MCVNIRVCAKANVIQQITTLYIYFFSLQKLLQLLSLFVIVAHCLCCLDTALKHRRTKTKSSVREEQARIKDCISIQHLHLVENCVICCVQ